MPVVPYTLENVPARKMQWRRAWRALQGLIDDPERTDLVFEIVQAFTGRSFMRNFRRFARDPDGQRLLATRPSLLDTLTDRDRLLALPPGTLGRCYGEFMAEENLTADGLVAADEQVADADSERLPAEMRYYGDRVRDQHDLWHVLTGYGRDEAGEAANLAFTLGQFFNPGIALIVGASAVIGAWSWGTWQRYLFQAWRRGRAARSLATVMWEDEMSQPLTEVRARYGITPAAAAHPRGVFVYDQRTDTAMQIMRPSDAAPLQRTAAA